ncbi:unnamed protein product [Medioppia subpectinata]|uniref:Uncharacterized protein n=1 Tax=Medioppia subpectinata TaxID=1979941 RepID=A0A7R9KG64_9ACAR|nr:unnamed protein product [Medioppia subpectinata]CAG2102940.1 unnamed protein product [Medioppia subpectinata]
MSDHCYHVHDIVAKGGANNKMVATDLACTLYQNDLSYCKRPTIAPTVSQEFEPLDDHGGDQPTITHITIETSHTRTPVSNCTKARLVVGQSIK